MYGYWFTDNDGEGSTWGIICFYADKGSVTSKNSYTEFTITNWQFISNGSGDYVNGFAIDVDGWTFNYYLHTGGQKIKYEYGTIYTKVANNNCPDCDKFPCVCTTVNNGTTTTGYADLTAAFTAIGTTPGTYTVTLYTNQTLGARPINTANQHITLIGNGAVREIQYNGAEGSIMFTVNNATASLTLGNNITLKGISGTTNLVQLANGSITMQAGSKITGHSTTATTGAVRINGGTFTMEDGEISGNISTAAGTSNNTAGGVSINSGGFENGTFIMNGGSITGNTLNGTAQFISDVYFNNNATGVMRISGSASIETLMLNAFSAVLRATLNISGVYSGTIGTLNLRAGNPNMDPGIAWWDDKHVIQGHGGYTLTPADIDKFNNALVDFVKNNQTGPFTQAISNTHTINASGVLVVKP
jgi:hypothetical protein